MAHNINLCEKLVLGMFICPFPILRGQAHTDNLSSATDAVLFSHTTQPFPKEIIYSCDIIIDPQQAILEREAGLKKGERSEKMIIIVNVGGGWRGTPIVLIIVGNFQITILLE